uniref:MGAT4 family member D n=1 Tax=Sciurus vulgaris TaxID=55149 RepID=A0A8D2B2J4_SCIVU
MRTKQVNLLISFVAVTLFSFSCFCISKLTQTYNQLISCRSHVLEFRENMLHLKNKTEHNRQELLRALNQMKYEITLKENVSRSLGKLFRTEDLPGFVQFFLMFYKDKPIDWLLETLFQAKMCDPAENFRQCTTRLKEVLIQHKPSLFQHVGIHSSFPGKEQYFKKI